MIGGNHGHLAAALVPELLSTHPFFMTAEPDVDDPACILTMYSLVLHGQPFKYLHKIETKLTFLLVIFVAKSLTFDLLWNTLTSRVLN